MSGEEEGVSGEEVAGEEVPVGGEGEPAGGAGRNLTEEEIALLEQQMRELTVDDLLTQSVVSILNLTARRIGKEDEIDLDQARTGIEAVRALVPLLPEEIASEIREPLSQIQMLYASRSGGGTPPPEDEGSNAGRSEPGRPGPAAGDQKPDSGLWTPPGS